MIDLNTGTSLRSWGLPWCRVVGGFQVGGRWVRSARQPEKQEPVYAAERNSRIRARPRSTSALHRPRIVVIKQVLIWFVLYRFTGGSGWECEGRAKVPLWLPLR